MVEHRLEKDKKLKGFYGYFSLGLCSGYTGGALEVVAGSDELEDKVSDDSSAGSALDYSVAAWFRMSYLFSLSSK